LFHTRTVSKNVYWHRCATMTPTLSVRFQCSTTAVVSPASRASVKASTGAALVFHRLSDPGKCVE